MTKAVIRISVVLIIISMVVLVTATLWIRHLNAISLIPNQSFLLSQLQDAEKIKIFSTETSIIPGRETLVNFPFRKELLFQIEGKANVSEVVSQIKIKDGEVPGFFKWNKEVIGIHCMCKGNFEMQFLDENEILGTISFHHGDSIRWLDGPWWGDAELVEDSGLRLVEELESKGFSMAKELVPEFAQPIAGGDATR